MACPFDTLKVPFILHPFVLSWNIMPGDTAAILQPCKQKPLTQGRWSRKIEGARALDDSHQWLHLPLTSYQVIKLNSYVFKLLQLILLLFTARYIPARYTPNNPPKYNIEIIPEHQLIGTTMIFLCDILHWHNSLQYSKSIHAYLF